MNETTPAPSKALKVCHAAASALWWMALALCVVLTLAWGALHGWIVPRIGQWRPALEAQASQVLGVPVRIGAIEAQTQGMLPSFELRDVTLQDAQGREALRLSRVVVAVSPRSLWSLDSEQLYLHAPSLEVRRGRDGRIRVAGLDLGTGERGDGSAADWLFRQREFVVREGSVRWVDEALDAPPLELRQVDLVLRNGLRRHALRLDATPPAGWGQRFSLRGQFRQPLLSARPGRWQEWDGQVFADAPSLDLSQVKRYADLTSFAGLVVEQGQGAVRAWADVVRARITGGTLDLDAAQVALRFAGEGVPPLALRQVAGRLIGKRPANGFDIETRGLRFETEQGQRWPSGDIAVAWTDAGNARPPQGRLRVERLDLGALAQVAGGLPLGTAAQAQLTAHAPRGVVQGLQARWVGPLGNPSEYEVKGRATDLELAFGESAASAALPVGVRGASLEFSAAHTGGKARIQVQRGALWIPAAWDEPMLPLDQLTADVQWQLDGSRIAVAVSHLKLSNQDVQGEGQVQWRTGDAPGPRLPGVIDLNASLSRAEGNRVWRYLPRTLPQDTRDYVRQAIVAGQASEVRARIKGAVDQIPYGDGRPGEFRIASRLQGVTYAYAPFAVAPGGARWPPLTGLGGELVFQHNTMTVRGAQARFAGAPNVVVRTEARIADLRASVVEVTSELRGPLAESLAVVNASPLAQTMDQALGAAQATGNADIRLRLALPIADIDRSRVQGSVTLAGNDFQLAPDSTLLQRARGLVLFNERGFQLQGVQARALGGEARLEGGSRAFAAAPPPGSEGGVQLRVQGTASAEGLRQARELGVVSRLARRASGSTAYSLTVGQRRGQTELQLATSLQGLALDLPVPLGKSADAALPLRYEQGLLPTAGLQDQLLLELGRLGTLVYQRDLGAGEPRVLRGAVAIGLQPGEQVPLPERGVQANLSLGVLDIDAWETVLAGVASTGGEGSVTQAQSPLRTGGESAALGYLPTTLAVRARALSADGRTLHNVLLGGSRDGLTWRANVDARELNGYIEYRQSSGAQAGRLYARLARLDIPASDAGQVEALLDEQPATVPALDVVVDDFELRGRQLGRLEIDAVNRGAGTAAREWRLNKLSLQMPEAQFSATGNWAAVGAQGQQAGAGPRPSRPAAERRRTVMNFRLDVQDSGQLLTRFGMKDVVRRGRGKLEGQVAWSGSPLSFDYPSLSGAFSVNMEGGQFLKAEPGIAKLLGVLSLQALPRRLTLDFRDVFSEGFGFDFVRGDIAIQQGIASTNNLQMKGVNAAVLMEGRADIARETQQLRVVVVPEINAGTASLVASVINPAVGLGTFLAQMFLREPLARATTQEFAIEGTWADPRITRIDRRATGAGTAAAPSAAPTSGPN